MNTFQFFNNGFGRHVTPQTNQPHADAWQALSMNHEIINKDGDPSKSRLTGWAIVRPDGATAQAALTAKEIQTGDTRTRFEAFADELEQWDGSPRIFLSFSKAPVPIANLFITADLRAVRICAADGVETFDHTKPAEGEVGMFQRNIEKLKGAKDA